MLLNVQSFQDVGENGGILTWQAVRRFGQKLYQLVKVTGPGLTPDRGNKILHSCSSLLSVDPRDK